MAETIVRTAYRTELRLLLRASTLTPGRYQPSAVVRTGMHAAVLVGGRPAILCGPHDDTASVAQAQALATSSLAVAALRTAGYFGPVTAGSVPGSAVTWQDTMTAIVSKPAGHAEDGTGNGPVVAIVLDDPAMALAAMLSVTTETARALDPGAPDLDDGTTLGLLARAAA
ncbi:hypothetical protein [Azospirillum sp. sgz302134]